MHQSNKQHPCKLLLLYTDTIISSKKSFVSPETAIEAAFSSLAARNFLCSRMCRVIRSRRTSNHAVQLILAKRCGLRYTTHITMVIQRHCLHESESKPLIDGNIRMKFAALKITTSSSIIGLYVSCASHTNEQY
jgi:hypothetical protein